MVLRQLEYLAALAREKHFGRAAEACHVSQPTLSAAIRLLEDDLGAPIVERGHRYVGLTPQGLIRAWAGPRAEMRAAPLLEARLPTRCDAIVISEPESASCACLLRGESPMLREAVVAITAQARATEHLAALAPDSVRLSGRRAARYRSGREIPQSYW